MLEVIEQEYFCLPSNGCPKIGLSSLSPDRQELLQKLQELYNEALFWNQAVYYHVEAAREEKSLVYHENLWNVQDLQFSLRQQILQIRMCALHASEAHYKLFLPHLRAGARTIQAQAYAHALQLGPNGDSCERSGFGRLTIHVWMLLKTLRVSVSSSNIRFC